MSLLEKAKEIRISNRQGIATQEEMETAISWAKDEITIAQLNMALNKSKHYGGGIYCFLARSLRQAIRKKLLTQK